jgi:hypothetical protein
MIKPIVQNLYSLATVIEEIDDNIQLEVIGDKLGLTTNLLIIFILAHCRIEFSIVSLTMPQH